MDYLNVTGLSLLDWIIIVIYLTLSLGLGLFFAKKVKSMADFVSAGRNIGLYLGVASMAGTEMGLITIMYSAQKGFSGGFAAFHIAVVAGIFIRFYRYFHRIKWIHSKKIWALIKMNMIFK